MQIFIGKTSNVKKAFSQIEVNSFNKMNGDTNPIHYDSEYAARTRFGQVIVPGPLTATVFGGLLGSKLPGPGTILLYQSHRFLKPIFLDEENTYSICVTAVDDVKKRLKFSVVCIKSNGEIAIEGDALVLFSS